MKPHVRVLVGRLVGPSQDQLHYHAPIEATILPFVYDGRNIKQKPEIIVGWWLMA